MASTILAVGLVSAASAATLSGVSGPVLVDSGKGFVKVSAAAEVAPGARVMISKGGQAVLAYADGCSKALGQNTVTTVVASGACNAPAQVAGQAPAASFIVPAVVIGGTATAITIAAFATQDSATGDNGGPPSTVPPPISR
ncbi:hypothetical protein LB518_21005 [Mesorhizobium sp. BR1-1-16]|uniref:hypothetical protein n=1 Tax=Mesorhizobium sp. BR1-1-16 TaxID=2876653 RepID=UPI001CCF43BC|nr:hypothetical protein [Mesorhizobium sp. BR1-1-16]MBZ9938789.1 hypothetical protein [Mesorhizobium sp. BR1-1-16]